MKYECFRCRGEGAAYYRKGRFSSNYERRVCQHCKGTGLDTIQIARDVDYLMKIMHDSTPKEG